MRTLILMRHAQAASHAPGSDRERPLSDEGREQAAVIGETLRDKGIRHVLCSSATRARETVECLALGDVRVEAMDALYDAGTETLAQRISEIEDDVDVLLVVAHAPGIPALAAELTYAANPQAADALQCWYPAGAFSELQVDGSWADIAGAQARLTNIERIGC